MIVFASCFTVIRYFAKASRVVDNAKLTPSLHIATFAFRLVEIDDLLFGDCLRGEGCIKACKGML